mgnify:CR=1 FL=1
MMIQVKTVDGTVTEYSQVNASINEEGLLLSNLDEQLFRTNVVIHDEKVHVFDQVNSRESRTTGIDIGLTYIIC